MQGGFLFLLVMVGVVCVSGGGFGQGTQSLWEMKHEDLATLVRATHAIIDLNGNGAIDGEQEAAVVQGFADQADDVSAAIKAKSGVVGYATASFLEFASTFTTRDYEVDRKKQSQSGAELEPAYAAQFAQGNHLNDVDQAKLTALVPQLFSFHDFNNDGELTGLIEQQGVTAAKDFYGALHAVVTHPDYGTPRGPKKVDVNTMISLATRGAGTVMSMIDGEGNFRQGASWEQATGLISTIIQPKSFIGVLSP